jgi:hypothetical protein
MRGWSDVEKALVFSTSQPSTPQRTAVQAEQAARTNKMLHIASFTFHLSPVTVLGVFLVTQAE